MRLKGATSKRVSMSREVQMTSLQALSCQRINTLTGFFAG